MRTQKGVVVARSVCKSNSAASLYLRCYKNSPAGDCDPVLIAEKSVDGIVLNAGETFSVQFEIDVPSRGEISLFVHIDVTCNGKIEIDDYLTTYSVVLPADRSEITVWVDRVE